MYLLIWVKPFLKDLRCNNSCLSERRSKSHNPEVVVSSYKSVGFSHLYDISGMCCYERRIAHIKKYIQGALFLLANKNLELCFGRGI